MTSAQTPHSRFDPLTEIDAAASLAQVAVIRHRTGSSLSTGSTARRAGTESAVLTVVIDLNTDESQSPDEVSVVFRSRSIAGTESAAESSGDDEHIEGTEHTVGTGGFVEVSDALGNMEFFGTDSLSASEFRHQLAALLKDWRL